MGIGGIGINAVQGAAHAGASHVIAVDPVAFKREKAHGARRHRDLREHRGGRRLRPQRHQRAGRRQGAGHRRRTEGRARRARRSTPSARAARVVVTGLGDLTEVGIPINPSMLALFTKEIQGALFGDQNPSADILKMLRLYQEGQLKLDELITTTGTSSTTSTRATRTCTRARTSAA